MYNVHIMITKTKTKRILFCTYIDICTLYERILFEYTLYDVCVFAERVEGFLALLEKLFDSD